jgi:hypothetical protein
VHEFSGTDTVFDAYRKLRNPTSILEVVDGVVLQSLMQSFMYRERTGMAMLFAQADPTDASVPLSKLQPFPDGDPRNQETSNPFCAIFRGIRHRDAMCNERQRHRVGGWSMTILFP